jgi:hypothetical protein
MSIQGTSGAVNSRTMFVNLRVCSEIFVRGRKSSCAPGKPQPTAGYEQRMVFYLQTFKTQENAFWTQNESFTLPRNSVLNVFRSDTHTHTHTHIFNEKH